MQRLSPRIKIKSFVFYLKGERHCEGFVLARKVARSPRDCSMIANMGNECGIVDGKRNSTFSTDMSTYCLYSGPVAGAYLH